MDKRWYLDVNHFARDTSWAHGFMADYAGRALSPVGVGLVVLALLVVAGWWSARMQPERMPGALWAALGALVALGVSEPLVQLVARTSPYRSLGSVEVLVTRANSYSFPSVHAAAATAAICGLLLARRWRLAALAVVFGGLLLFSRVYVGAQYPGDVVGGAVLGVVVSLGLWPAARWALGQVTAWAAAGPLGQIVVAKGAPRASRKGLRRRSSQRPAQRLPDARAMDALRAASEAARAAGHHPVVPGPTPLGQGFQLKPGGGSAGVTLARPVEAGTERSEGSKAGNDAGGSRRGPQAGK